MVDDDCMEELMSRWIDGDEMLSGEWEMRRSLEDLLVCLFGEEFDDGGQKEGGKKVWRTEVLMREGGDSGA